MAENKGEDANILETVEGEVKNPEPLDSEVMESLPPEVNWGQCKIK